MRTRATQHAPTLTPTQVTGVRPLRLNRWSPPTRRPHSTQQRHHPAPNQTTHVVRDTPTVTPVTMPHLDVVPSSPRTASTDAENSETPSTDWLRYRYVYNRTRDIIGKRNLDEDEHLKRALSQMALKTVPEKDDLCPHHPLTPSSSPPFVCNPIPTVNKNCLLHIILLCSLIRLTLPPSVPVSKC